MAGRIPPAFIDDLLARTDIVELINARVPLRKAGKDYQARCPFHDEKTPSFTVSREKQFYHCFGCGAHGTAIGFLMEYDRLEFPEAVEELARHAGVEVQREEGIEYRGPDRRPLYDLLDRVAALYSRQLREHPDAHRAIDYLKARGLTGDAATRYDLGFAPPGWDFLPKALGHGPHDRQQLLDTGMIIEQEGKRYDRFRDRIMFPIRDRRGRIIGFGGRILGDGKPKYLNSPETPLFRKGHELYGLYQAQHAVRNLERLLVVEGYMDVIALAQFGIPYAVATLGTATTPDHLQLLLRAAPELIFCFDGDQAGRSAAWKALETSLPFATGEQQIRFLFLPDGEDPDSLVRKEGRDAFEHRAAHGTPLSEFLFAELRSRTDMSSPDGRVRLASLARPFIEAVPLGLYRTMLENRLSDLIGIAVGHTQRHRRDKRPVAPAINAKRETRSGNLSAVAKTVALLLQHPEVGARLSELPTGWRNLDRPGIDLLLELSEILTAHPGISTAELLGRWETTELASYLQRLTNTEVMFSADMQLPQGLRQEIKPEPFETLAYTVRQLNAAARRDEEQQLLGQGSTANMSDADRERLRMLLTRRDD